jgi:hypothetical protein
MSSLLETIGPDTTSFLEAQASLRAKLGTPVVFKTPTTPQWPAGTKLNSVTGEPLDPTIKQENAEFTETTKTCLIIKKQASPLRPQSDTQVSAVGFGSGLDIIVDIAQSDYEDVEAATDMLIEGLNYQVRETKPFAIAGTLYRQLIYAEQH